MIFTAHACRPARIAAACALAALLPAAAIGQQKTLTLDDIYDPDRKVDFDGNPPRNLEWIDDAHYLWPKTDADERSTELFRVEALSGKAEPLFDVPKVETTLAGLEGVTADEAKRTARQSSYTFSHNRTALLLTIADDLYLYDLLAHRAVRLTRAPGREEEATLSPDGAWAAFVRSNDLHVVEVRTRRERALTTGGSADLLNGKLDWVYQEEMYGRGKFRAYWWSPDSSRIAFLQLDEKAVPRYTIVDEIPYRPTPEVYPYPKAGDPNPTVRLGVVSVAGGRPRGIDLSRYERDHLICDVGWTPDSRQVVFQVQDREQTWLDLDFAGAADGAARTVLKETSKTFVEVPAGPRWLKDGTFLWSSERTGFKHLYHYRADGTLVRQVTDGRWEARTLHGVDEAGGWIYFSGTERSPIGGDVYRVRLDGRDLQRLSAAPGTHVALFNPSATLYIDTWSDAVTPPQVRLHRADGTEARTIDANPVPVLAEYRLSKPEFLQVKTRDGFVMEAMMIKPPGFDPGRRYPVYQHTYGGPHAQTVKNAWGAATYLYHQLLAQKGIVVWMCDNRTASGKGIESTWPAYMRLGETELRDVEDGVAWLKSQGFVDGARIGINGWSYGGFMVSYALTHSRSFAMGIAGAPVTDWRLYDSIYTERMMLTPQNNPEGYRAAAPRLKAAELHGELLLLHGAIDDNVHPQNSLQFAYELQRAGKPFRMMLYPGARHAVGEPALLKHLRATMLDFIRETLLGAK
jgi:dipeptidyl-peptidase-4